jgi:hypothetical protein
MFIVVNIYKKEYVNINKSHFHFVGIDFKKYKE